MAKGRKRKAGKRERNGQLSRKPGDVAARLNDAMDREQRDTISVAVEARQRVHGVDAGNVRDQMAGSFIGRLCMSRTITRQQYEAAMLWLEDATNYAIAVHAPRAPGAIDLNRTQGGSGDYENVARTLHIKAKYEAALSAVQGLQIELRGTANLYAALDYLVRRDLELQHMVGDLRLVANCLAKHYGLTAGKKAA